VATNRLPDLSFISLTLTNPTAVTAVLSRIARPMYRTTPSLLPAVVMMELWNKPPVVTFAKLLG